MPQTQLNCGAHGRSNKSGPFDAFAGRLYLGRVLEVRFEQEGERLFDIEGDDPRALSERRARRATRRAAAREGGRGASASTSPKRVTRAFTHYFQLVNLAEQQLSHRGAAATTRARERSRARSTSSSANSARRSARSASPSLLESTAVELVFTAHPSEAQRRTVLEKHRRLVSLLARRERAKLTPAEVDDIERAIREGDRHALADGRDPAGEAARRRRGEERPLLPRGRSFR